MAITKSAGGVKVKLARPFLVTQNDVTFTLDGSATSLTVAGVAHGGPTGTTPDKIEWIPAQVAGDSTDSVAVRVNFTTVDTTNDEVDFIVYFSAAGTSTKTVVLSQVCTWYDAARQDGQSIDSDNNT